MGALTTAGPRIHRHPRRGTSWVRFLGLHMRARLVPYGVVAVALVAAVSWAAAGYLMDRPFSSGPDARIPVVVAAPLVCSILLSMGLGGRDELLERSTAVPWRAVRAGHVVVMATVPGVALALTGMRASQTYGAFELVRNTAGFAGVVLLAAVALGAGLAWLPVGIYAGVVYLAAPRDLPEHTVWWTWPLQPWGTTGAAWVAAALFVAGLILYCRLGARAGHDHDH
ncbi:hypothetical protein [Phytoactinopolyspora mesophila]|uniref:Uncharacterized protein n=1 Tax=Phytoactinopolyspora mesophila TaxID=2650750 RepID=A0A7K3M101_9ACTN|nr:hypothetical protein [Phytoactinopolyspora mesophila]NDL56930.1 hypothetical protein [Phytoactinopolyspora mesophila]